MQQPDLTTLKAYLRELYAARLRTIEQRDLISDEAKRLTTQLLGIDDRIQGIKSCLYAFEISYQDIVGEHQAALNARKND